MSQDYFAGKGKGPLRPEPDPDAPKDSASPSSTRPHYMTVGTGSTSDHAARLQNMLDVDSGYGGSAPGEDHHTTMTSATHASPDSALHARGQASAGHQIWYYRQRAVLSRSINKVLDLLQSLRQVNTEWPAHYPTIRPADATVSERPAIGRTYSVAGDAASSSSTTAQPPSLMRSRTSIDDLPPESSRAAETRPAPEPRLVSPQITQELSVLKLDLKLGALHQAELVHSLEKNSIAALLDGRISSSIKHLLSLRERIEDTSSKVLITGDLNAGKSTFCNALLRRKVLPEDQQPCTAIFCEVLDARDNAGIEEVHAVHKECTYSRHDESTYDVYPLIALEKIVTDNEAYTQCKVYVKDIRTADESLLNNGVVDIALIDAPGLNSDTTQTTAIFARQEEIDVVVFVVSAANHFTQSAKEFIWAAAAEKAYLFIVVNGYDTIRDKERCQKLILDQVSGLSPDTHKESSDLVHFVSSNAIPAAPAPPGGPGGGGSGSSSGGGGGDDPSDDGAKGKGKGKDMDKIRDFEALEASLRRFVLEKRARSKLAPARTYLLNILNDIHTLAHVNEEVAQSEVGRVTAELKEIEPQLASSQKARLEVSEQIDRKIEETCQVVYDHTRSELNTAIAQAGSTNYDVPYPGVFGAFQYAEDIKEAMLSHITDAVTRCEEYGRSKSVQGVNTIKQLGLLHVGDEFQNLQFRPDAMFRRKRDALARQVHVPTELWDFVDWSTLLQRQEKFAGTGMALTVAGAVVPRMLGMGNWMDHAVLTTRVLSNENLRQLIVPGIVIAAIAGAAYVLQQIPNSLPPRLATKISSQLAELDYIHANSFRISSSVRKILRFPADNLRVGLDQSVKDLGNRRDEADKVRHESEEAAKFFHELVGRSQVERSRVEDVDLDAPQELH
ncbi:GTPase FZO1 [Metarhizium album ARSEF 1941]|uniref:GTPase FZO1 n=1 Tax=Metarhizium album (strain ARSEF 1941) TaxID=1081103 RepID=A0A0B2WTI3_METAS|nr:GTPase FZO1 [Metarhizium album ARSEF 1941]KHN96235.1 GTPase FZO1 [Metarhizium album ARSEF 1941]